MLVKEPENRFSVVDVLSHPWTQTYYLGTIRHLKSPTTGSISTKSVLSSMRETSMVCYLQQLFAEEIEAELEEKGSYEVYVLTTQFSTTGSAVNSNRPSSKVYIYLSPVSCL